MCSIDANGKLRPMCSDLLSSGGDILLTDGSRTDSIKYLCNTDNIIGYGYRRLIQTMYQVEIIKKGKTNELFNKISHKLPAFKPDKSRNKLQALLTDIGGKWYLNKLNEKLPPLKKPHLSKEKQAKEYIIKDNMKKSNYHWNDRKLQIRWYNMKWVYPKKCNAKKNNFCMSSDKLFFKDEKKQSLGWPLQNEAN